LEVDGEILWKNAGERERGNAETKKMLLNSKKQLLNGGGDKFRVLAKNQGGQQGHAIKGRSRQKKKRRLAVTNMIRPKS